MRQQEIACGETCADYCERLDELSDERDALQAKVEELEASIKELQAEIEELQAQPELEFNEEMGSRC